MVHTSLLQLLSHFANMATTATAQVFAARPRANGSGSNIPLRPSSLQRARHTPAAPSTIAICHTSNVTRPSRLPVRSVAPARAPNVSFLVLLYTLLAPNPAPSFPYLLFSRLGDHQLHCIRISELLLRTLPTLILGFVYLNHLRG